jgi:hypothetical protein
VALTKTREAEPALVAAVVYILLGMLPLVIWRAGHTFALDYYVPLAYSVGVLMVVLAGFEWRRVGHPLTPMGVLALGGLLLFVLRPLSVHGTGLTTAGALAQTRTFRGITEQAGAQALVQVAVFYLLLGLVYLLAIAYKDRHPRPAAMTWVPTDVQARRTGWILAAALVVALGSTALLLVTSGGIAAHFSGVSYRGAFLEGRYYLTLGYVPLTVALTLYVIARRNHTGRHGWNLIAVTAAAALLATAFTTGGRGPLLLGAVLPLLMLKQVGPRPFRTPALVVIGVGMMAGAMVMSLVFRENVYTGGAVMLALTENPVQVLLDRLTSGQETRPFDSLIVLNEADLTGRLDWQLGWTYLAVVTWFLPGRLVPWKEGGANTWFTREFIPDFYYPFRIETSISAIGESYANFSWPGILVAGALVGWAAAALSIRRTGATLQGQVLYVVLTPLFFSFVRGDAYQNISLIATVAALTAVMVKIVQDTSRHQQPRRASRPRTAADRAAHELRRQQIGSG